MNQGTEKGRTAEKLSLMKLTYEYLSAICYKYVEERGVQ